MEKSILAGILLAWATASWAADTSEVKPGLWEVTTTYTNEAELSGKDATAAKAMPQPTEEELAKLTPEARAETEARMQGRRVVGSPKTATTKVCHTDASWARAQAFGPPGANSCKILSTNMWATRQEIQMECDTATRESDGTTALSKFLDNVVFEPVDSEHAKASLVTKREGRHPTTTRSSYAIRWLSADCGDVKPQDENK